MHSPTISQSSNIYVFTKNITINQTKATGKLTQLSKTFMFTLKANSKQKCVKNTQEHETGHAVREQLTPASKSTRRGEL